MDHSLKFTKNRYLKYELLWSEELKEWVRFVEYGDGGFIRASRPNSLEILPKLLDPEKVRRSRSIEQ